MRKSDSWLTLSTSGELFMMVLTRVMGRLTLAAVTPEGLPDGEDILNQRKEENMCKILNYNLQDLVLCVIARIFSICVIVNTRLASVLFL